MRNKSLKRKISNVVLLGMLLAIVVGIYYNIFNSKAEDVVGISALALDSYGYLENEEFDLEAKDIGDGLYEIELPGVINSKVVNEITNVTLVKQEAETETENTETTIEETEDATQDTETNIEEQTTEVIDEEQATETTNNEEVQENEESTEQTAPEEETAEETTEETLTEEEATEEVTEEVTEEEQNVENTTENTVIEVKDNKITLSKEQLENTKINIEVVYEIATIELDDEGEYREYLLADKTKEERNEIEQAEMYYNKVLKYEDEENGKLVEIKGFLPQNTELKIEEVTQEKLTEIFGDGKVDAAYDIKLTRKVRRRVPVDEENPNGETQEIIETVAVNPEEFGGICEVSIKDSNIAENSQIYHVKEDNTYEILNVAENTEGSISFEARKFSTYATSSDEGIMLAATDTTGPTVNLEIPSSKTYTNQATITVMVTASDASGIDRVDVLGWYRGTASGTAGSYYNTVTATETGTGTNTYTATLTFSDLPFMNSGATNNGEGEYRVKVYAYDTAGNSASAGSVEVIYDVTPPTGGTPYASGIDKDGYTVGIDYVQDALSGIAYVKFPTWSANNGQDDVIWDVGIMVEEDASGLSMWTYEVNTSAHNNDEGVYYTHVYAYDRAGNYAMIDSVKVVIDRTAPTCTITADKTSPTNASSIIYTFTFSEAVTGFATGDVTVTNGTKGTSFTKLSDTKYTLEVTNSGTCTQTVSVAAGKYTDSAGNSNTAAATKSIIVDRTAPTCTITADKTSPTNASSITYTFTFSEAVTGFATGDVTVTNGTKGTFTASSSTVYTLVVTNSGTCTQTITVPAGVCTDSAGNGNTAGSLSITVDRTKPTGSISVSATATNQPTVTIYIYDLADEGGSGIKNTSAYAWFGTTWQGKHQSLTTTYDSANDRYYATFTFANIPDTSTGETNNGEGTYTLCGNIRDNAGNLRQYTKQIIYDVTAPTITVSPTSAEASENVDVTITAADAGGSGFSSSNKYEYQLGTSATEVPTGTWNTYTSGTAVTLGTDTTGEYYLWVKAISDGAGNTSTSNGTTVDTYHVFGKYMLEKSDTTAPTITIDGPITAELVTADDYGEYVSNYVASNATNDELGIGGWRIFHSDGENIYLIADDYVNRSYVPAGKGGTAVVTSTSYAKGFTLAPYANYTGWSDLSSTSIATKWLSKYATAGYTSTYTNMRATAYLLDTNVWSGFKDSNGYADYAVGGPTLELYTASYNATHEIDIDIQVSSANGYKAKWSTGSSYANYISGLSTSESLYVISSTSGAYGMGIATPHGYSSTTLHAIRSNGYIYYYAYNNSSYGSRPIIALNSNVQIEKQSNGTYLIVDGTNTEKEQTWEKSHDVKVVISDEETGLAEGATLQYGWSTSTTTEPTTWTDVTVTGYEEGATNAAFTATGSGITGKYYLWVKPVTLKDIEGNSQTETEISEDTYWFDNESPTITVNPTTTEKSESVDITITAAETGGSGFSSSNEYQYQLGTTATEVPTGTWSTYQSGTANTVGTGLEGEYYLWVKAISDVAGNTSTSNGTLTTINETNYHVYGPYTFAQDETAPTITIDGEIITAATLASDDYGGYVTNYVASNGTNDELGIGGWRIFHSDGENIYLIADDYIITSYVPTGKGNTAVSKSETYARGFSLAPYTDYQGWSDISNTSIASKWLSQYVALGYPSSNINMKATAYLLDTNQWSAFANSSYAEYAIGGPTIELFVASYNKMHGTDIETQVSPYGYQLKWVGGTFADTISGLDTSESLYVISSTTNASGMWVASPSNYSYANQVLLVSNKGNIAEHWPDRSEYGARPIIALKSDVQLEKQSDGSYLIVEETNTDEAQEWAQTHSAKVTISDAESGLAQGATLQYGWSTSKTEAPTTWTDVTVTGYEEGALAATFTATGSGITGKHYLWVKPVVLKDTTGNSQTETEISEDTYWFDNTAPAVPTITNSSNGEWTNQDIQIDISSSDNVSGGEESGIVRFEYSYDNSTWNDWDGSEITTENDISSTSKTYTDEINETLYIRAVDEVGNTSEVSSTTIQIDRANPTITVSPTYAEACQSVDITITAAELGSSGFSSSNEYKFQMGRSNTEVPTKTWTTYQSGIANNIGTGLSGQYYLWVKAISDKAGNTSTSNGITVDTYHVYGPYIFDNIVQSVLITGEATEVTDGLIRHYDGTNNLGNGHSNDTTTWKDLSGNQDAEIIGATVNDNHVSFNGVNNVVEIGSIGTVNAITLETSIMVNEHKTGTVNIIGNDGISLCMVDGKSRIILDDNQQVELNETLDLGKVYNISATYDGTTIKLYVDGILHAESTVSGITGNITSQMLIEAESINVYSARIYNRALSQNEIKQNLNADRVNVETASNDSVTLSFIFAKDVVDFDLNDITVTNGTKGTLTKISNSEYTLKVTDIEAEKNLTVSIAEGSYTDEDENLGSAAIMTRYRDTIGPVATITTDAENTTTETTIKYNIKFNEATLGFNEDDITITSGTIDSIERVSSTEYNVVVTTEETVNQVFAIRENAVFDIAGNGNVAATKEILIDITAPTIIIDPTQNTTWSKSHSAEVTIEDLDSGLAEGAEIQYAWSTSNTEVPTNWKDATLSEYTSGTTNISITIVENGLTGINYLWIKPTVKDTVGNTNTTTITTGEFWFDNTAPNITIQPEQNETWAQTHSATVTIEDLDSGLAEGATLQYGWSISNEEAPAEWEDATISEYQAGAASATFTAEGTDLTGKYYLWVKPTDIRDISLEGGNAQTATVISAGTFYFDNTKPTVTANPEKTTNGSANDYVKSQDVTITIADTENTGLSLSNSYQYYLSSSDTVLSDGEWKVYTSGQAETIGEGKTGTYYLFVKTVSDNAGNVSNANGTFKTVQDGESEITCHMFGPYKFDNANPTVTVSNITYSENAIIKLQDTLSGISYWAVTTEITEPTATGTTNTTEGNTLNYWYSVENTTGETTVTFTGLSVGTYYAWGKDAVGNTTYIQFTVGKNTVTVTANGQTITYGENIGQGANYATLENAASGHKLADVTLTPSIVEVGTGTITPTRAQIQDAEGNDVTANYEITYVDGTLTINKKAVTVTANDQTITYGESISQGVNYATLTDALSAHTLAEITLTPSIDTVGTGTITPSSAKIQDADGNDVTSNYEITYVDGTLEIKQKAVTITANNQTITYGESIAQGPDNATLENALNGHTLAEITLTQSTINAGTGTITPSSAQIKDAEGNDVTANYDIKYVDGILTINKKAVTVTAKDQTITYGESIQEGVDYATLTDALSEHTLADVTLTPSISEVGTGTITPSGAQIQDASGNDVTANYEITYVDGTITINKKAITVTAKDQTITYGESIQEGTDNATLENALSGHTLAEVTLTPSIATAGTGTITPSSAKIQNAEGTDVTSNYDITYVDGTLTINKKAVTVAANDQTITYGESISQGVDYATLTDALSGHTLAEITLTQNSTNAGTGTITPSNAKIQNAEGTDVTANYEITYVDGTLTINKKAVTVTAKDQTITYGESIQEGVAYATLTDALNGHTLAEITLTQSITTAGTGTITPSSAKIQNAEGTDVTSNYEITYVDGTLSINKKAVTVTAKDQTITYGENIGEGASYATLTDALSEHTLAGVTLTPSISEVGTGTITPSGAQIQDAEGNDVTANYEIAYVDGTLTINKKAVTVTAKDQTITYGESIQEGPDNATLTDALSGHTLAEITLTQSTTNAGTGTITPSSAKIQNAEGTDVTSNYEITYVDGTLEIKQKAVTVTANNQTITYGGSIQEGPDNATLENALSGHTLAEIILTQSITNAGTGTITPSNAKIQDAEGTDVTANYEITYVDGTLEIKQKAVTVTANDQTITYGESISQGVDYATLTDALSGHTLAEITLTQSTTDAGTGTITPSNAKIQDAQGNDVTANYDITYVDGLLTINPATPTFSVDPTDVKINKGTETTVTITYNGDGELSVESSNTGIATASLSDKTITIKGIEGGTATITVKAAEGSNYTAPTTDTLTIAVTVYAAPTTPTITAKDTNGTTIESENWSTTDLSITIDGSTLVGQGEAGDIGYQYSYDGINWNNYTGAITYSEETAGTEMYARAYNTSSSTMTSGIATYVIKLDKSAPTVTATPDTATWATSTNVTITLAETGYSGLSLSNSYQYYLSSSNTALTDGEWKDYTSGTAETIGEGKTGTYYLFVKTVSDNAGNVSSTNGTLTTITDGEYAGTYHMFGAYLFDNTVPTVTFEPNGNETPEKSQTTKVTVVDSEPSAGLNESSLKYVWTESLEEPADSEFATSFTNGQEITLEGIETGGRYLWIMASDNLGNTVKTVSNVFNFDNVKPTISVNPDKLQIAEENIDVIITVEDSGGAELAESNEYKYYLSSSNNALSDGEEKTYESGKSNNIGTGLTGTYYLFVKQISDESGNLSEEYGTLVTLDDGTTWHRFGEYLFDNSIPEVVFGTNGNTDWEREHSTTVTLTDTPSGVNESTFKYLWTQSTTAPTKAEFEAANNTFTNGGTVTSPEGVTGNNWYLWIYAEDNLGHTLITSTNPFYLDNTVPSKVSTITTKLDSAEGTINYINDTWTNHSVYIALNNDGEDEHSGVQTTTYTVNGGAATSEPQTLTETGTYEIVVTTTDNVGLTSSETYTIKIDKERPTAPFDTMLTMKLDGSEGTTYTNDTWTKHSVYIEINDTDATDAHSGYKSTVYSVSKDGTEILSNQTEATTLTETGTYTITVTTMDKSGETYLEDGNITVNTYTIKIDKVEPIAPADTTLTMKLDSDTGATYTNDTWTKHDVYIAKVDGTDEHSGHLSTVYSVSKDGTEIITNKTEATTLTETGVYTVTVTTMDKSGESYSEDGNITVNTYTIRIDKTAPIAGTLIMNLDNSSGATYTSEELTNHNVYIALNDGSDEHSGHLKTTYNVYYMGTNNSTETDITKGSLLHENQTEPMTIEETGRYIIVVTTEDKSGETYSEDGNKSTNTYIVIIDQDLPTVTANPDVTTNAEANDYVKTQNVTLTVGDIGVGLDATYNESEADYRYQYYLSDSATTLNDGTWTNYTSGEEFTIGEGKTGTYYLFVKTIKDKAGNVSANNTVTIGDTTYHQFGPYKFDNTVPTITANPNANPENGENQNVVKELNVTLTYEEPIYATDIQAAGISDNNTYEFYLSTSATELAGGIITTVDPAPTGDSYIKTATITIGAGETGVRYLFVRTIFDDLGNESATTVTSNGINYQLVGTYIFDNTAPSVQFEPDGNETWSQTHSSKVTVTDQGVADVDTNTFKYLWVQGDTQFENAEAFDTAYNEQTVTDYKGTFTNGGTVTSPSGVTGDNWYLWIYAEDNLGNASITRTENTFKLDNTLPRLSVSPDSADVCKSTDIIIVASDIGSGVSDSNEYKAYLSESKLNLVNQVEVGYTPGETIKNVGAGMTGWRYLFVRTVNDNVGLESEESGTIVTASDGYKYHVYGPYIFDNQAPKVEFNPGENQEWETSQTTTVTISENAYGGSDESQNKPSTTNGLSASEITADAYGQYVTNYVASNGANVAWKIFHTDGENIYLIADDYVEREYVPTGKKGTAVNATTYARGFGLAPYVDYEGWSDISSTNVATKWLSQYVASGYASKEPNMKATAYLLDTNQWSGFKNSAYADYAVGGPTLELFVASYNATHEQDIETQVSSIYGYKVRWKTEDDSNDYVNSINLLTTESLYTINNTSNAYEMWIASPSSGNVIYAMMVVQYRG